jgi:hypothetical protein
MLKAKEAARIVAVKKQTEAISAPADKLPPWHYQEEPDAFSSEKVSKFATLCPTSIGPVPAFTLLRSPWYYQEGPQGHPMPGDYKEERDVDRGAR